MRIDVHTHVFHDKIAEKACAQIFEYFRHPLEGDGTEKTLISMMDRAGIDKAFVLGAATNPDQVIPANTWTISLGKKERFIPFGTIHPGFREWEKELDRLEKNGVRGIKIHPEFQGFNLDAEIMFPLYEAMQKRFAVLFHVGDRHHPDINPSSPQKLSRVLDNFPDLTCIAAHFGGYLHWEWTEKAYLPHISKNLFIDTSSSLKFMDDIQIQNILKVFPEESILFGSDYPVNDPNDEIELLKSKARFTEERIDRIMRQGLSVFDRLG